MQEPLGSYSTGNGFSGDYDEVKFFDAALTDDDILREYTARVTSLAVEESATDEMGLRNYGGITGSGTVTFAGAGYHELLAPLSFSGLYRLYSANVDFGTAGAAQAIGATSSLEIANGGAFNFFADQTVASLSGEGLLGQVTVAAGKTFTVAGDEDTSLEGSLGGTGSFVKSGTGTLALRGPTEITNVSVRAGTLVVGKTLPFYAQNLKAYYRFEETTNICRDLCGGFNLTAAKTAGAVLATASDGKLGTAASLRKGTTVACGLLTPAATVPSGQKPFTVSAWIRPNGDSPSSAYVLVNRTIKGGCPNAWSGATWDGWHVRFWGGNQLAAGGYSTGTWTSPGNNPDLFAVGTLPNATGYKDGQWHQVVITRDEALLTTLYFDGREIVSKSIAANQNVNGSTRLVLGGMDTYNSFSGDYDEVQIFTKALTADEIAANYAATKPLAETPIIDEATARWTFDELETEGDRQYFRETGSAKLGCDFLNTTNSAGKGVLCVSGEGINGGAAYVKNAGSYLQLADGAKAGTNLVQYGWPTFTISIRIKNVSCTGLVRNPVFCFGNATTAQGCLRLSYESQSGEGAAPQAVRILAGNSYTNGASGVSLTDTTSTSSEKAPWVTFTFVNNQDVRQMRVYRDGQYVQTLSTHGNYKGDFNQTAFDFDLSRIDIGYNTYGTYSGFMVDDLCVFRKRVLSDEEVGRLVREQAGATAAALGGATVAVDSGASLKIDDRDCAIQSLSGEGEVNIGPYATLAAQDWSGFDGTLTGAGAIVVSGWGPKAKVSKAIIAETGTVAFGSEPEIGSYPIVTADTLELPNDFSGWTVQGLDKSRYTFKGRNGVFRVVIKGGMVLLLK